MSTKDIRQASLADLERMNREGKLYRGSKVSGGEDLGPDFWANAKLVLPKEPTSVHLKLDPEVFDFFKSQGKGHLTRMQDVLKAYVRAHTRA